ncbi:hypothetical protein, partial [Thiolapillus sp.]|uniref:hypothetical protein n=1 Tax=Thiolapillus sp. TaxID=2017437 RepID=UPI003AF5C435
EFVCRHLAAFSVVVRDNKCFLVDQHLVQPPDHGRGHVEPHQACLRPRDRFWDIPVPKIDSAFDNLFVPQPSWSPSTTQQLRKLVAAPYLAPNDWTPRSEAYFVFPLAQGTPGKQCGLAATGVYQPSLRSPWLAADGQDVDNGIRPEQLVHISVRVPVLGDIGIFHTVPLCRQVFSVR